MSDRVRSGKFAGSVPSRPGGRPRVITLLLLLPTPPPPCPAGFYSMVAGTGTRKKAGEVTIEAMVGRLMPLLLRRQSEEVACRDFNMYWIKMAKYRFDGFN